MTIPQFTAGQVLTAAQLNAMVDAINAGGGMTEVEAFTASGTFTVPTGVTYAIAHIRAGGGGTGDTGAGAGGTSSVAFAGGTISATGGGASNVNLPFSTVNSGTRAANSGQGAFRSTFRGADVSNSAVHNGGDGAYIVAGGAVTPAASITVTVGAGGTAGTSGAAGGSGYVWIEYVKP
jgi:hypothetical protein